MLKRRTKMAREDNLGDYNIARIHVQNHGGSWDALHDDIFNSGYKEGRINGVAEGIKGTLFAIGLFEIGKCVFNFARKKYREAKNNELKKKYEILCEENEQLKDCNKDNDIICN